jgi:hypothetical protein
MSRQGIEEGYRRPAYNRAARGCNHRRHSGRRSTRSPGFARRPAPAIGGSAVNRGHPRAAPPPNLADVYRQRVAELTRVLEADNAAEAWALVRSLVETITLVPEGGVLRIEVRGELAAILRIA